MTPKAQRIAVALALGWTDVEFGVGPNSNLCLGNKPCFSGSKVVSRTIDQRVPDYLTDLNATHGMEEMLTFEQRYKYVSLLLINRSGNMRDDLGEDVFPALHATAARRTEAFLRTLNLWTDAQ